MNRIPLLSALPAEERRKVVVDWNRTSHPYPDDKCIHELFEDQVERTPDAVAIVHSTQCLSYGELNARANRLARRLRALGVGPEVCVALCADQTPETVVTILGILKAGGIYVPLDPDYPQERLEYILDDSQAAILLTAGTLDHLNSSRSLQVLSRAALCEAGEQQGRINPRSGVSPDNAVYFLYTSGSTGRPKGVIGTHRALCNLAWAFISAFHIKAATTVLQSCSFAFDGAASTWVTSVLAGGRLVMTPPAVVGGRELQSVIIDYQVEVIATVPSVIASLPSEELPALRTIAVGGEKLPSDLVCRWASGRVMINGYGPTETTVGSTLCIVAPEKPVTIGVPLSNTRVYVLDEWMQPLPVGIEGELYIGGVGVTRGYWQRPEMTADRFVPDPFDSGSRVYRTGDRVRWTAEGTLDFLGRMDEQVKIRGHRIEPGEIETALKQCPGVREVAVIVGAAESGEKYLAACVVAESAPFSEGELRARLSKLLPAYMVPSRYVLLPDLPLTPNHKVDKAALHKHVATTFQPGLRNVSAQAANELCGSREGVIAGIWADLLGLSSVGLHDNFFMLGGDSLLATQSASRISDKLKVELPMRVIFESPTIARLIQFLDTLQPDEKTPSAGLPIIRAPRSQPIPLSPAQLRMWLSEQFDTSGTAGNIVVSLTLNAEILFCVIEQAIAEIVRRHEVLRTTFDIVDETPVQIIRDARRPPVSTVDLQGLNETMRDRVLPTIVEEAQKRRIDLYRGPVINVGRIRAVSGKQILLINVHHIAVDDWSQSLLLSELSTLVGDFREGRPASLSELGWQYSDIAWSQVQWATRHHLDPQRAFWKQQLEGSPTALLLPVDREHSGATPSLHGGFHSFVIPPDVTKRLQSLGAENGATLFMSVLAVLKVFLYRVTGEADIVVGTDTATRRPEIENVIGFFINVLALRTHLHGQMSFKQALRQVRDTSLVSYAHRDLPYSDVLKDQERDDLRKPLFNVFFTLDQERPYTAVIGSSGASAQGVHQPVALRDLSLFTMLSHGTLKCTWCYRKALFESSTIDRFTRCFLAVVQRIQAEPDVLLDDLPWLSARVQPRRGVLSKIRPKLIELN